jgi:uncharacterized protein
MKVIITGGSGLIGRALTARLVDDSDEVVILSRGTQRPPSLPQEARIVQWDAQTGRGWHHELENTDALVNLAGANLSGGRWTKSRKRLIRESRLNAGRAVVDAVKSSGHVPLRVIQASGISYYGDRRDALIDEDAPPGEDFLARLTVEWEASTAPLDELGASRAMIRTAPVLSANEGALPPMVMPFFLFAGGRLGSGEQGFPWIHLADEVEAIRFLLHHSEITGPLNLCAPNPVSNRELTKTIGQTMNRPSLIPMPEIVLRGLLGEVADTVLLGQYAVPKRLQDAGFAFKFPTIDDALRDLLADQSRVPGTPLFRQGMRSALQMFLP